MKKLRDIDFIQGERQESFEPMNELGKVENYFFITKGNETRKYKPLEFFNLILDAHYEKADKITNNKKKLVALANAESTITRYILDNKLNKGNDNFSDLFSDIDITRRRLKAYETVNEKRNDWLRSIGAVSVGVILSVLLQYFFSHPNYIQTTVVVPKTDTIYQIKHDTIFIKEKKSGN
jgi:hypothetical protein